MQVNSRGSWYSSNCRDSGRQRTAAGSAGTTDSTAAAEEPQGLRLGSGTGQPILKRAQVSYTC